MRNETEALHIEVLREKLKALWRDDEEYRRERYYQEFREFLTDSWGYPPCRKYRTRPRNWR